jgi:hypothetical protein
MPDQARRAEMALNTIGILAVLVWLAGLAVGVYVWLTFPELRGHEG